MKALLRKEWMSFLKDNIAYLIVILIIYLFITSLSWIGVIDILLIIYALAVSPVISMIQSCSDGWRSYEVFAYHRKQRILFRYAIFGAYALMGSVLALMVSHELIPSLCAFFSILCIPAVCLPVYLFRRTSKGIIIAALIIICLLIFPSVLLLDGYFTELQVSRVIHSETQALLYPQYTLLPAFILSVGGLAASFLIRHTD